MGVLLEGDVGALARAVVGVVPLRGDYEVPAELLEVHHQGVAAAEGLVHLVIAVEAHVAARAAAGLHRGHLHEGRLQTDNQALREVQNSRQKVTKVKLGGVKKIEGF